MIWTKVKLELSIFCFLFFTHLFWFASFIGWSLGKLIPRLKSLCNAMALYVELNEIIVANELPTSQELCREKGKGIMRHNELCRGILNGNKKIQGRKEVVEADLASSVETFVDFKMINSWPTHFPSLVLTWQLIPRNCFSASFKSHNQTTFRLLITPSISFQTPFEMSWGNLIHIFLRISGQLIFFIYV